MSNNLLEKKKEENTAMIKIRTRGKISLMSSLEYLYFKLNNTTTETIDSKAMLTSIEKINGGAINNVASKILYSKSLFITIKWLNYLRSIFFTFSLINEK